MTPVKVDGSGVTQPVSGTVTANIGSSGSLALESGGNLATLAAVVRAEDSASADADKGIGLLAIRKASPANTSGTDGDYEYLQISAGRLWASATIDAALPAGSNVIGHVITDSTSVTNATLKPATSGGLTIKHLISGASTNATNVKASAGQLYGWTIFNTNAAIRYVKLHNSAGTPTAGSGVVMTIAVPPSGGSNISLEQGIAFSTGIAFTTVTGTADADSTGVGSNDLTIDIFYA